MTDSDAFAPSFERLSQDQLFKLHVLFCLAAAGLESNRFQVGQCHRRIQGRLLCSRVNV